MHKEGRLAKPGRGSVREVWAFANSAGGLILSATAAALVRHSIAWLSAPHACRQLSRHGHSGRHHCCCCGRTNWRASCSSGPASACGDSSPGDARRSTLTPVSRKRRTELKQLISKKEASGTLGTSIVRALDAFFASQHGRDYGYLGIDGIARLGKEFLTGEVSS